MKSRVVLCAVVTAVAGSVALAGSGNRTGTSGATELLIPAGTRYIAMGGAGTAITSGVEALFWNPAGAAKTPFDVGVFASHMQYIADIGVNCAAVSVNVRSFGVLSLELKGIAFGDISITTADLPDGTGATYSPQFLTLGLTYSLQLTDRVSIGVTGMLISESMDRVSATGVAFSMGVIYDNLVNLHGLSFGVAVKNIGPQMQFDGAGLDVPSTPPGLDRPAYLYRVQAASFEIPTTIELGLGFRTMIGEDHALVFAATFQNNTFSDDEYKAGMEYGYKDLIFIRGGYDYSPAADVRRENIFGASFGAGVHAMVGGVDIRFDYAFRSAKIFTDNHVFSVTIGL
jgi:hypothetical protein